MPIVGDVVVVVTNSNVKHELVDGEYAKRRAACEEALAAIKTVNANVCACECVCVCVRACACACVCVGGEWR